MADSKITDLQELLSPATDDVLAVVDISQAAAADKNKKIKVGNVLKGAADGTASAPSLAFASQPNTGIYRPSSGMLGFSANGLERARVDYGGKFLIGLTSTSTLELLQVGGSAVIDGIEIHTEHSTNIGFGNNTLENATSGASQNTALGQFALRSVTSGDGNTAVGYQSLYSLQTGTQNTAVGHFAGQNCTGTYNTAIGANCLKNADNRNTGLGKDAGLSTTGSDNTYVGYKTGSRNLGGRNVAVGNYAFGHFSTGSTDSSSNTAIGYYAMGTVANGASNTFVGSLSGSQLTNGSYNTCMGVYAGSDITTGSGNIVIGDLNAAGTSAPVHTITTADNRVVMGSTAVTNAYIQVGWTTVSDERDKTNFAEVPHGLDFVTQLNPVAFQFRESRESDVAVGPVRYGFKAQEVMALEGANPVIIDNEDQNRLKYTAEGLVPVLVNAIKEQQQQIAALQARIDALEAG